MTQPANASRYQFLRDRFALESSNDEADFAALAHLNGDEFDAALDAAMAQAGFEIAQEAEPVAWPVTVGDDFKNCIEITHCKEDAVAEYERAIAGGFESIYRIRPLFTAPQAVNADLRWIAVADRLPELHQSVALINIDQYENVAGDWSRNTHAAGYLEDAGNQKYWAIRGERGSCLDAYTHWLPLPGAPA
jgi:hypothetical protein